MRVRVYSQWRRPGLWGFTTPIRKIVLKITRKIRKVIDDEPSAHSDILKSELSHLERRNPIGKIFVKKNLYLGWWWTVGENNVDEDDDDDDSR